MTTADTAAAVDRRLIALAVPALFTLAAEPIYLLVDTAIVGHLGAEPLGGLALAGTVLTTAVNLCNALSWGTATRVANLLGAGDRVGAARVSQAVLWLSLTVGVTVAAALAVFARVLPALLGGEGAVLEAATTYLRIGALGVPAVLLAMAGQGVCRGQADMRTPLVVIVAANVANAAIEVLFVYGFEWGIAGSAWGTVLVQMAAGAYFARRLVRDSRAAGVRSRPDPRTGARFGPYLDRFARQFERGSEIRNLVQVARDLAIRTTALLATLAAATSVAARLGAAELAAHQVAIQLVLFLAFVMDSVAIAAQTLVAHALGAGDLARAALVATRAVRITVIVGAVVAAGVALGREALPGLFVDDAAVVEAASRILPLVAVMQIPGAVAFALDGVLMGAGDYRTVRRATVAGLLVFLGPAAWVVTGRGDLRTLWLGLLGWITARAVVNAAGHRARHT